MTLNNQSQAQMRAHQRARAEAALDAFRDHAAYGLAPFIAWIAGAPRANRRKQLWLALSFEAARVMNATVIKGLGFTPSFVKRAHDAIAEAARADPAFAAALSNHIAILGKTGSGKTSTAKLIVEHLVDDGDRVCILDPLKSDWWGLISSADGKAPGLPFQILGGPRGHAPLHAGAGTAIGELVGGGKLPLSIIDMGDFEPGGLQRFFIDFAAALMKAARGVVYLVIEEAHEFAPKERAGLGAESLAIHWAKKLATAGRSKGIRLIFSTQRTQSLHNACLSSCETIIAHRLTTPDAQAPVVKWLQANTDKATAAKVAASLASLKTGAAWACSGEARLFQQIAFPKFRTFDNSRTPARGDGEAQDVKAAPVDIAALRALIGEAAAEAERNDPKALRAEIERLKRTAAGPTVGDVARIEAAAEQRGFERGLIDRAQSVALALGSLADAQRERAEAAAPPLIDARAQAAIKAAFAQALDRAAREDGLYCVDLADEVRASIAEQRAGFERQRRDNKRAGERWARLKSRIKGPAFEAVVAEHIRVAESNVARMTENIAVADRALEMLRDGYAHEADAAPPDPWGALDGRMTFAQFGGVKIDPDVETFTDMFGNRSFRFRKPSGAGGEG